MKAESELLPLLPPSPPPLPSPPSPLTPVPLPASWREHEEAMTKMHYRRAGPVGFLVTKLSGWERTGGRGDFGLPVFHRRQS